MTARDFNVEGMSCNHCVMAVTKALQNLTGIEDVQVSLEENKVTVCYDDSLCSTEVISQTIEELGYKVLR